MENYTYAKIFTLIKEFFDEFSTFSLGDDSITIDIVFSEESVELWDSSLWSVFAQKNLVKHSKDFSLVEISTSVDVKLHEEFVGQIFDKCIISVWSHVKFHESCHFLLGNHAVFVKINVFKEFVELRDGGSWFTFGDEEIVEELQSFSSVEVSTSIDVIFEPDLVYHISDFTLWDEILVFQEFLGKSSHFTLR
jgi:hypothetical protein